MPMAVMGGIAGAQKDKSDQTTSSGLNLSAANAQETAGQNGMMDSFNWLKDAVNSGPGQGDVSNAYNSSQNLASMLGQYAQGGYMPSSADTTAANNLSAQIFQGQQTALNQSFQTQNQNHGQQAALMGRDPNDPVFRAKLAYQQTQQQQQLSANQGSWASQYALSMPQQRLGYAQQQNNVLGGLATQAMANRQALASMGQGIMNNERDFRLQTATRWGNAHQESGGGLKGALQGVMAGASMDMKMAGGMMGAPSMGGGAGPAMGGGGAPNPFGYGASGSFASSPMYSGGGYGGGGYA